MLAVALRARWRAALGNGAVMSFVATPATAAWSHRDARSGFEVAYFQWQEAGYHIDG